MNKHLIESQSLDYGNWAGWDFRLRIEARKEKVFNTIYGSDDEPLPADPDNVTKAEKTEYDKWEKRRDDALHVIVRNVKDSQFEHIRDLETDPAGMYARLKKVHTGGGLGGAIAAWKKFNAIMKDPGTPMKEHIGHIRAAAFELEHTYSDAPSVSQVTARILSSLPKEYDYLVSIIDSQSTTDLDYVVGRVLNAEKDPGNESFVTSTWPGGGKALSARDIMDTVTCSNCGRTRHTKDNCFWKGGGKEGQFPDWWKKGGTPDAMAATAYVL